MKPMTNRKFKFGLIVLLVLLAGLGLAVLEPGLAGLYVAFSGAVVATYTIFCGGNVLAQKVAGPQPPSDNG